MPMTAPRYLNPVIASDRRERGNLIRDFGHRTEDREMDSDVRHVIEMV
jgi:hypothetical protein